MDQQVTTPQAEERLTPQTFLIKYGLETLLSQHFLHRVVGGEQTHDFYFLTTVVREHKDLQVCIHVNAYLPQDPFRELKHGVIIQRIEAGTVKMGYLISQMYGGHMEDYTLVPLKEEGTDQITTQADCFRTAYRLFTQMRALLFSGEIEHSILQKGDIDL